MLAPASGPGVLIVTGNEGKLNGVFRSRKRDGNLTGFQPELIQGRHKRPKHGFGVNRVLFRGIRSFDKAIARTCPGEEAGKKNAACA